MARDMAKKKANDALHSCKYRNICVKIRKDSGILDRIKESGMGPSEFAKQALTEKLIRDGYLKND